MCTLLVCREGGVPPPPPLSHDAVLCLGDRTLQGLPLDAVPSECPGSKIQLGEIGYHLAQGRPVQLRARGVSSGRSGSPPSIWRGWG